MQPNDLQRGFMTFARCPARRAAAWLSLPLAVLATAAAGEMKPAAAETVRTASVAIPLPARKPPVPASAANYRMKKKAPTAKQLFGTVKTGAPIAARAVGFYAKGCLAGAKALAVDGPGWQVMRLSRNRNWGHPKLIALVERLARETTEAGEWPGLLVGDISQPRGGPMVSGHSSHQVGLDADIWLTPMPDRTLSKREREDMSAVSMLAADRVSVNRKVWGEGQEKLIKRAASYPEVERVLVHPALKKALCESPGAHPSWLRKVRPVFGHFYHFHIRMSCPANSTSCQAQHPVGEDDGCGKELEAWLKRVAPKPPAPPTEAKKQPAKPAPPRPPKPEMTLADLPDECSTVLKAGGHQPPTEYHTVVDRSKNAAPKDIVAPASASMTATNR